MLKMAFTESECSVLSESRDDFHRDEYDTCSDDYFTDNNSIGDGDDCDDGVDEPQESHQVCVAAVACFDVHMSQSCV
jgi:hypothetical protein